MVVDDQDDYRENQSVNLFGALPNSFNPKDTGGRGGGGNELLNGSRHRHSSGFNVRPVPVDSVGARNAASAVVTSDMMNIFNPYQN